jgi:hypothetical protein
MVTGQVKYHLNKKYFINIFIKYFYNIISMNKNLENDKNLFLDDIKNFKIRYFENIDDLSYCIDKEFVDNFYKKKLINCITNIEIFDEFIEIPFIIFVNVYIEKNKNMIF